MAPYFKTKKNILNSLVARFSVCPSIVVTYLMKAIQLKLIFIEYYLKRVINSGNKVNPIRSYDKRNIPIISFMKCQSWY